MMRLIDLEPDDPRVATDLAPVVAELRAGLNAAAFVAIYAEGYPQGLRFTAAYDETGHCGGVAGWRVLATTRGRILFIDDLVTTQALRSKGVGRQLMSLLEDRARRAGCVRVELDSGVANRAHHFYFRERMRISAFHFAKNVEATP